MVLFWDILNIPPSFFFLLSPIFIFLIVNFIFFRKLQRFIPIALRREELKREEKRINVVIKDEHSAIRMNFSSYYSLNIIIAGSESKQNYTRTS
jgi:hypothetical protein